MLYDTSTRTPEPNYLNWELQNDFIQRGQKQLLASNFQDIYSLTKRVGEMEVKMNKLKYRAQGIGGMIGIAAGALGGPLGSVVGYGVGRSVGSFVGNGMARKYYGQEQLTVNEHLHLAKSRDSQLKYQIGEYSALSEVLGTLRKNKINDDKKMMQDVIVL